MAAMELSAFAGRSMFLMVVPMAETAAMEAIFSLLQIEA
jgi:hypothetical protein